MKQLHIAVVGAGFCGLALAYYLSQHSHIKITLFDQKDIGQGTSGIAAGLLHPFAGTHAKLNWRGYEAMAETLKLLDIAESSLGQKIYWQKGMLRLATNPEQMNDYTLCCQQFPNIIWRTAEENQACIPYLTYCPGIFIDCAVTVDCPHYLKGLWLACAKHKVRFEQRKLAALAELKHFDATFVAMGAFSHCLPETAHLPITQVKGQVFEFVWPKTLAPLPFPINSHAYITMHPKGETCIAGASFERDFNHLEPDVEAAKAEIMPKLRAIIPEIDSFQLISCRAGVRASTPDHLPLVKRISEKTWALAGMGSRGLLYHALLAKELSQAFVA